MKKLNKGILTILITGIVLTTFYSFKKSTKYDILGITCKVTVDTNFVGTWVLEEDTTAWKLVFTNNKKCKEYIQGALSEIDTVIVSTTSPSVSRSFRWIHIALILH